MARQNQRGEVWRTMAEGVRADPPKQLIPVQRNSASQIIAASAPLTVAALFGAARVSKRSCANTYVAMFNSWTVILAAAQADKKHPEQNQRQASDFLLRECFLEEQPRPQQRPDVPERHHRVEHGELDRKSVV